MNLYKKLSLILLSSSLVNLSNNNLKACKFGDTHTPLMCAIIIKESPLIISNMIAEGADVNAIDMEFLRYVNPVLRYALKRGVDVESVEIIRILIKAGANVNATTYNRIQDKQLYGMMPLLTYAVIYSSAEIVQMLVDAGARDVALSESPITFKKTALAIARELGKTDIVKILEKSQECCATELIL